MNTSNLITIKNCRIDSTKTTVVPSVTWEMKQGESWLIIGPNGGGKADFVNALSGFLDFIPNPDPTALYANPFADSCELVSLERAARLIQEERENDESEYVEGGVDIGRTGRVFIAESICGKIKKNAPLPEEAKKIEAYPAIKLCGIEKILDRGLKYMSTGEIRRTLLARALISGKKLLVLSDPFAGLDIESRTILLEFINTIQKKKETNVILAMERWHEIPDAITHVLEFKDKQISFCGCRSDYEKILSERDAHKEETKAQEKQELTDALEDTLKETQALREEAADSAAETLIEMNHVNVGWGDHKVLVDLSWKLKQGEHWLIRGPNGSGKTTFLELITGDNKQVYANDVHLFGIKRGTGESIWDIKKQLGICSYRMHVEYRMLGGTSLQNVIVSGFRDSIGLYGAATDVEVAAAKRWLKLGGFEGREYETFGALSYGEQRAILILRSAVKCPKVLILDEPCHGLDEQYRQKILDLLELIGNGGTTTMLHVTHDPSEVLPCEKHILELHPNEMPMYKIIESENRLQNQLNQKK